MADLGLYTVKHRNFETTMKLSEEEAESLGAERVGDVAEAEPQPVTRPPWAVDEQEPGEKKAPAARNKSRHAASDKS